MTKEFLCDSCREAEIKVLDVYKPLYASSSRVKIVKQLTIWCNFKFSYIHKLPTFRDRNKCNYHPKSGKIGKKLYQKQLGET